MATVMFFIVALFCSCKFNQTCECHWTIGECISLCTMFIPWVYRTFFIFDYRLMRPFGALCANYCACSLAAPTPNVVALNLAAMATAGVIGSSPHGGPVANCPSSSPTGWAPRRWPVPKGWLLTPQPTGQTLHSSWTSHNYTATTAWSFSAAKLALQYPSSTTTAMAALSSLPFSLSRLPPKTPRILLPPQPPLSTSRTLLQSLSLSLPPSRLFLTFPRQPPLTLHPFSQKDSKTSIATWALPHHSQLSMFKASPSMILITPVIPPSKWTPLLCLNPHSPTRTRTWPQRLAWCRV